MRWHGNIRVNSTSSAQPAFSGSLEFNRLFTTTAFRDTESELVEFPPKNRASTGWTLSHALDYPSDLVASARSTPALIEADSTKVWSNCTVRNCLASVDCSEGIPCWLK